MSEEKPKKAKKKNNEQLIAEYQAELNPIKKKKLADEIYKKNYRLVIKNAGKMPAIYYGTQDDLIQETSLIFMKCLNKFDTTRNFKFSTYFGDACRYELRRYKDKQMKYVDKNYYLEIDEVLTAKPYYIEDILDDNKHVEEIQKSLHKLYIDNKITSKQFYTIIEEHGFFGATKRTRKEMAEERDCTLQNIGFLYRKGINKIKEDLKERGIIEEEN